jgi:hypothetical protein
MIDIVTMPRVAPSKPNYFVGHPAHDGSHMTIEQQRRENATSSKLLMTRKLHDLPDWYKVSVWFAPKSVMGVPHEKSFICPVVQASRDRTRICVIAPNGMDYWTEWK